MKYIEHDGNYGKKYVIHFMCEKKYDGDMCEKIIALSDKYYNDGNVISFIDKSEVFL